MPIMIGIDFGSHSVKLSIFEGSFGRYQFQSSLSQTIPTGAQPLEIRQSEALSRALSNLNVQNPTFVAAFPANDASARFLHLPFGDPAKVEQILPFQVEGLVPFDISDMIMTHRIVSIQSNETDAMACLVSREKIISQLATFDAYGFDPSMLPIDADALTHFSSVGNEAILDIGHSRTLCTMSIEGKGATFRHLPFGMNHLIQAIVESQNISIEEATQMLWATNISMKSAEIEGTNLDALYQARDQMIQNIQNTLILFEDSVGLEIDRVQICGGGSSQKGMIDLLEMALGVPVDPVQLPQELQNTLNPEAHALSYALGCLASGNSQIRVMDLRKDSFSFRGNLATLGKLFRMGVLAAMSLMAVGFAWFGYQYFQLTSQISELNDNIITQVTEAMPEIDGSLFVDADVAYTFLQSDVVDSTEKMNKLGSIIADEPPVLSLLQAISENLPAHKDARIDVSELNITDNAIVIKAATDGFEDAAEMEAALRKYPQFKETKKSNEEKGRRNQGIEFTISIPLEIEEEVEEEI
jgi:Tfp pilus assembly PilM family ATPase